MRDIIKIKRQRKHLKGGDIMTREAFRNEMHEMIQELKAAEKAGDTFLVSRIEKEMTTLMTLHFGK